MLGLGDLERGVYGVWVPVPALLLNRENSMGKLQKVSPGLCSDVLGVVVLALSSSPTGL